jgi:hypothetical protein
MSKMNNTRAIDVIRLGVFSPFIGVVVIAASFMMATEFSAFAIFDKTYNFEAVTAVPESGTLSLLAMSMLALGFTCQRATNITN